MEHSNNFSDARKHQTPSENEYTQKPPIHYKMAGYRLGSSHIDNDPPPRWLPVETETEPRHQHIYENRNWQPSQRPPSPPHEESQMTVLPSFSAISKIADDGVKNSKAARAVDTSLTGLIPLSVENPEVKEHEAASPRNLNSLDSYHHHNYPPTPPLSLSCTSRSGLDSSSRPSTSRSFLQPLRPTPMPMIHFTCADTDSKPHFRPTQMMTGLEPHLLVPSSSGAKRHCARSEIQPIQPLYDGLKSRHESSRPPEQYVGHQSASIYPVSGNSTPKPSSFYTTTPIGFEHHHYISPASAAYPLPQERYNCPECGRAFSRPSSLKIHTYSHTGEKPFYCPVRGCNKNFSVRSNMKRHERGCHARKM